MPVPSKLPVTEAFFNANWASMTVGNATPFMIDQIKSMLKAKKSFRQSDDLFGANEPTLTTIFSDGIS